jgi:hypothetical protein
MSGGIILGQERSWIVAGWAAENAADYIRRFLNEPECRSVRERMEAIGLYAGSLADFSDSDADELRRLHGAAVQGLDAAKAEGSRDWHQPDFFPGFLERFTELVVMISCDPRLRG